VQHEDNIKQQNDNKMKQKNSSTNKTTELQQSIAQNNSGPSGPG
jgi:hypothetical protein